MKDLEHCYRVFGLKPGASLEEVNQAYKELARIWHPDRFSQDDPQLQQEAVEKLKEINHARDLLRSSTQLKRHKTAPAPPTEQPQHRKPPQPPRYQSQAAYQPRKPPQTAYQSSNAQTQQTRKSSPDLSGADFRGANLQEKDLSGRNLSNANLSGANLSDAFLHKINLNGANLHKANLHRANLLEADLRNANLQETNLIGADLSGANLSGANLTGARVEIAGRLMVKLTGTNLIGTIMPNGSIHD